MTNESFKNRDGLNIFASAWRPEGKRARAVVVIVHGVNSHSGYYAWPIQHLVDAGYSVYMLDHRGRGKSDGERFFIQNVSEYVDDVETFIRAAKAKEAGLPVYVLGHSAGGVVSCIYTLDHQSEIAGLICESFAFQVYAPEFALAVLKGLSHVAPHAHVLKLPFEGFSRDPKVVEAMHNDPLIQHEVQPTSTVAALTRADERLKKEFALITLPVLILHGTADKVTNPAGSELFYDQAGSTDKTLKLYEGHVHDLLNDIGKETVMADIISWLDARIPPR